MGTNQGLDWAKSLRRKIVLTANRGRPSWFDLDAEVAVVLPRSLQPRAIPQADAVFATACPTALPVAQLPDEWGARFYLIQGYENWNRSNEEVDATWRLPMHKVVISRWLEEIGIALGESGRLTYIPNGVDAEEFPLLVPPEDRRPDAVGLLSHAAERKGTADGIAAVSIVRDRYPEVSVTLFGVDRRPRWLPSWVAYVKNPSHQQLVEFYNSCAIFLYPSWSEGFGLPPAEAMLSGCALVATANGGVQEYAVDPDTALLAPVRDPETLAERVCLLIRAPERRCRLARRGHDKLLAFTWRRAADTMENMLNVVCQRHGTT